MATASHTPVLVRPRNFQWYWNSSSDLYSKEAKEQWQKYTDVENEIIEDSYKENKFNVEIDGDYIINLKHKVQYRKDDTQKQRPIKRVQLDGDRSHIHLREDRFTLPVPITSTSPDQASEKSTEVPLPSPAFFPDLYYRCELRGKNKSLADIVEETAEGILKEGMALDKLHEAQWLAQQLLTVKHPDQSLKKVDWNVEIPTEVGETCVYLYTKESFLYRLVNQVLRNPTGVSDEQRKTLGPFCFLLQLHLQNHPTIDILTVYRGLNLTDGQRKQFMRRFLSFTSFTSTSRNEKKAGSFGNTLLIIDLNVKQTLFPDKNVHCGANISHLSDFPDEEEFLIWIYTLFEFVNYEYNSETKKHIIHLKASEKN